MCDIKLVIHDENVLYNPLDRTVISNDVALFIKDRISEIHSSLNLGIISDEPVDIERLKKAIDTYVQTEKRKLDFELRWNSLRQLRLFLIGIAFIALWLFASSKIKEIWLEVLSIIGSFAVWEAANIWVIDKPDIRIKKRLLRLLGSAEIRYTCAKDGCE